MVSSMMPLHQWFAAALLRAYGESLARRKRGGPVFGVFPGTVPPGKGIFDELPRVMR